MSTSRHFEEVKTRLQEYDWEFRILAVGLLGFGGLAFGALSLGLAERIDPAVATYGTLAFGAMGLLGLATAVYNRRRRAELFRQESRMALASFRGTVKDAVGTVGAPQALGVEDELRAVIGLVDCADGPAQSHQLSSDALIILLEEFATKARGGSSAVGE